jgi:hypothetical protein
MTRQDRNDRLNSILGSYLGLSDYLRICRENNLTVHIEHIISRMTELRKAHDEIETVYFEHK